MKESFRISTFPDRLSWLVFVCSFLLSLFMTADRAFSQDDMFPEIPALAGEELVPPAASGDVTDARVAPAVDSDPKVDRGELSFYEWDMPDPRTIPSLFFSPWTQALIKEYRGYIHMTPDPGGSGDDGQPRQPGIRELVLGGISYVSAGDWTIWLNGQRITPDALPEQVHDLRVTGEYIDLKWYDAFTNIIFPVRLRPHQRFNLDTRIFLPG